MTMEIHGLAWDMHKITRVINTLQSEGEYDELYLQEDGDRMCMCTDGLLDHREKRKR
jgi:serine/threonine protein phosphatase PrpC